MPSCTSSTVDTKAAYPPDATTVFVWNSRTIPAVIAAIMVRGLLEPCTVECAWMPLPPFGCTESSKVPNTQSIAQSKPSLLHVFFSFFHLGTCSVRCLRTQLAWVAGTSLLAFPCLPSPYNPPPPIHSSCLDLQLMLCAHSAEALPACEFPSLIRSWIVSPLPAVPSMSRCSTPCSDSI
jgi:hypothetical protein